MNRPNPLRILCVDDEKMVGDVLVCVLIAAGHSAEHVSGGFEAWDLISQDPGRFDVIITDHQMPGLTGLEFVELLKQADYRGRVIVHSGSVGPGDEAAYRALGVEQIVVKTARLEDLLQAVELGQKV